MQQWDVTVDGKSHSIVYEGIKLTGKARLKVDEQPVITESIPVKDFGTFFPFEIEESQFILKLDSQKSSPRLYQDGFAVETNQPIEEAAEAAIRVYMDSTDPLAAKDKSGMSTFLALVILTYVNLVLIFLNATISFPFSAIIPQAILGISMVVYEETLSPLYMVIGILVSLICASAYLLLYLFAKKRTWPVTAALVLMIIDTLALIFFAMGDFMSYLIDFAFHGWVIWAFYKLMATRRKRAARLSSDENADRQ